MRHYEIATVNIIRYSWAMSRPYAFLKEGNVISFEVTIDITNPLIIGEEELFEYLADNQIDYTIMPKTRGDTYLFGVSIIFDDPGEAALCYLKFKQ